MYKGERQCSIWAVVLAGGSGERMGSLEKQFLSINRKPILSYSIDILLRCPEVSGIILVVPGVKIPDVKQFIGCIYPQFDIRVIAGGKTRRDSSYRAITYINQKIGGCEYVIFHDGVRPTLSMAMITAVVKTAKKYGAAVLGSMALNVIARVDRRGIIGDAFNANMVYNTQTPHCYRFDWIKMAHEHRVNRGRGRVAYENIELVFAIGKRIRIVDDFYRNMKLTFPQDIVVLETLLKHAEQDENFFLRESSERRTSKKSKCSGEEELE